MTPFAIRPATARDRDSILALLNDRWGGEIMVVRDTVHHLGDVPALVATGDGAIVGLATFIFRDDDLELLSLDSLVIGQGIGSALLSQVEDRARQAGCRRVTLVTTNDNLDALRFYERRGYVVAHVDHGAVDRARRIKPSIPAVGAGGVPIRDELWLEKQLAQADSAGKGD